MGPRMDIKGTITALVTPFDASGNVDVAALETLVQGNIDGGVDGLVPCGTTGESPTLSAAEWETVVSTTVKLAKNSSGKKIPVIAGTGSNNTAATVEKTKKAKELGVDAALVVNPYYNKPNQAGLIAHFKAVSAVGLPIVLYNIPGRTNITMTPQTVKALFDACPEIVAIKEATGSLDMATEILSLCPDIIVLSGDDPLTLPLMSVGAKGVISVLSNLAPKMVLGVTDNALKGNWDAARKQHIMNFPVAKAMFTDTNPCPMKLALAKKGIIKTPDVRLPLVASDDSTWGKVSSALAGDGVSNLLMGA